MKFKKIILCMVLASFITTFGLAKSAHAVSLSASADVQQVLAVTATTALNFGTFTTDGTASTVTFNANGTIAGGTGIVLLGSEVGGVVTITAPAAGLVTITSVGTTLTGPGTAMALAANCFGPAGLGGTLGTNDGDCTFTTTVSGAQTIDVGGVLTVNASQLAGAYSGTITVTANFQ